MIGRSRRDAAVGHLGWEYQLRLTDGTLYKRGAYVPERMLKARQSPSTEYAETELSGKAPKTDTEERLGYSGKIRTGVQGSKADAHKENKGAVEISISTFQLNSNPQLISIPRTVQIVFNSSIIL